MLSCFALQLVICLKDAPLQELVDKLSLVRHCKGHLHTQLVGQCKRQRKTRSAYLLV